MRKHFKWINSGNGIDKKSIYFSIAFAIHISQYTVIIKTGSRRNQNTTHTITIHATHWSRARPFSIRPLRSLYDLWLYGWMMYNTKHIGRLQLNWCSSHVPTNIHTHTHKTTKFNHSHIGPSKFTYYSLNKYFTYQFPHKLSCHPRMTTVFFIASSYVLFFLFCRLIFFSRVSRFDYYRGGYQISRKKTWNSLPKCGFYFTALNKKSLLHQTLLFFGFFSVLINSVFDCS